MTGEELDASIELAKLVGYEVIRKFKPPSIYVMQTPDGISFGGGYESEEEAWLESMRRDRIVPAYANDLNATFALARKHGVNENRHKETIWYSPVCLSAQAQMSLFAFENEEGDHDVL